MKKLTLLVLLISNSFILSAQNITKHSEFASRVDTRYVAAMCKIGFTYITTVNSKKQLIYIFTKIN